MASSPTRQHYDMRRFSLSKCASQKRCYPDKARALDAAEHLMDEGRVNPGCHLTPYLCPDCRSWHIGNRRIVFYDWQYL